MVKHPDPDVFFDKCDEKATLALACKLATILHPKGVIALWGDLGSGKTTFARALIRSLTHSDEEVPSPTFTLVQTYNTAAGTLYHYDFYRLSNEAEVLELGWEESLATGINLIEWPERLGNMLPSCRLDVYFKIGTSPDLRNIILKGYGAWIDRLKQWKSENAG